MQNVKNKLILLILFAFSACSAFLGGYKDPILLTFRNPLPAVDVQWASEIEYSLKYFLNKDPLYLKQAEKNSGPYKEEMAYIFSAYGIPVELLNIAAIESKYNPKAKSSYGAYGVWQFMPATAEAYGLELSFWQDERKDPLLSTEAAARYLVDLYKKFQDWNWVMAAYNAGPTRVARIYRQHGHKKFWQVAHHLPSQTKAFVSRINAAIIIEKNNIDIRAYDRITLANIISSLRRIYV